MQLSKDFAHGYIPCPLPGLSVSQPAGKHIADSGSELLQRSLAIAAQSLRAAFLFVHTANTEALRFYQSRFGFQLGETVPNYYKRIQPPDAIILRKSFA
ncbi:hypothetical protein WJX74_008493 [Apatococcus lobatus]|uniref:N-acetyltransferase domain-containing protein n=1 Tax=Apatococcus lobatus TaxID=904363 RepID=A0AAW1S2Y5_9CHLO